MNARLALASLLGLALFVLSVSAFAGEEQGSNPLQTGDDDLRKALQACRAEQQEATRLRCFDHVAKNSALPDFAGKLGFRTKVFPIKEPTRLRFRSQGVIFVLYVLNERGDVLQNLHLGGGGEGDYVIREPGRYSLQIDGSARWQIWLEPLEEIASGKEQHR